MATAAITVPLSMPTLTASESSDGSGIDLNWNFDGTTPNNAGGFDLMRISGGVETSLPAITDPTTASYTDTGVTNGTSYHYRIKPYRLVNGAKVFEPAIDSRPASVDSNTVTMIGEITVTPPNPILIAPGGTAAVDLGFTDSNSSATSSATHTATIDWGDGSAGSPDTATMSVTEPGGTTPGSATASKSFTTTGTLTATVTITNSDGSTSTTGSHKGVTPEWHSVNP